MNDMDIFKLSYRCMCVCFVVFKLAIIKHFKHATAFNEILFMVLVELL